MKLELDERELKMLEEWQKTHKCHKRYAGAIGGSLTYKITYTSIGAVFKAVCGFPDCKAELDMSFYEEW